jgi:D-sedoheptulose 7-phosphate isomerase
MKAFIRDEIGKARALLDALVADDALLAATEASARLCVNALHAGGKILLAGNGGSASARSRRWAGAATFSSASRPRAARRTC